MRLYPSLLLSKRLTLDISENGRVGISKDPFLHRIIKKLNRNYQNKLCWNYGEQSLKQPSKC